MIELASYYKNLREDLLDLRREAFVNCLMDMTEDDNIIGVFGNNFNESLLYGYGLKPIPIVGIDPYIFNFGDYNSCDPVKSTIIYLKTEKCPLLYSSKMYLLDGSCKVMENALKENTEKLVYIYKSDKDLGNTIENVYNRNFYKEKYNDAKSCFKDIENLLLEIYKSDIPSKELFMVKFFTKYIMDLENRKNFLEGIVKNLTYNLNFERKKVKVVCPGGGYEDLDSMLIGEEYEIVDSRNDLDFSYNKCIYKGKKYLKYKRGVVND